MKFSSLGKLDCVCGPESAGEPTERRNSCRVCGHEVRVKRVDDTSMLDAADIKDFVMQLNQMVKRTDVAELALVTEPVEELAL